jgi:DNA-binding NarL/FixJ family response regulator
MAVLREAASIAVSTEHQLLTREIEALARRARMSIPSPHRPASPRDQLGLTPREIDVLRLLSDGLTNKQIAATLYISEKTAEHHVSRILGKLGVNTRAAAGSLAHQLGIRPTDAA